MPWEQIVPITILILITGGGIAICYFFVSRFKRIRAKILISFLIFGLLIGGYSFWLGKTDSVVIVNLPGSEISEIVYNKFYIKYLIPYWRNALDPVGYEEIPIIELPPVTPPEPMGPGKQVGVEIVPIYDYPLKINVSDLYIPVTLLFWGFIGLVAQLIHNTRKRNKSLPQ